MRRSHRAFGEGALDTADDHTLLGSAADAADEQRGIERKDGHVPDTPDPPPILSLIVSLLDQLRVEAETLECVLLPSDDEYAALLRIPREASKRVLLPRRALERAIVDPVARRRVRNLLRAAVEVLRSRRAIGEAGLTPYFTALKTQALPGPHCVLCQGPLLSEDPVVVHGISRWHLACPPAW